MAHSELVVDAASFLVLDSESGSSFMIVTEGSVEVQSFVHKEKRNGRGTQPCGTPFIKI